MSSDESVVSSDDEENTDLEIKHKRQKFLRYIAVWRSAEFQDFITSLDRKVCRKRTERSKSMVVPIVEGEQSDECPEWAMTIF